MNLLHIDGLPLFDDICFDHYKLPRELLPFVRCLVLLWPKLFDNVIKPRHESYCWLLCFVALTLVDTD